MSSKLLALFILILLTIEANAQINRPQEPKEPFNYTIEEVTFENNKANNIKLAGTLTIPKKIKKPPVAILISGSGAQNRDEEVLGHKPFWVLSDYLTNNGIAVLRYDDRGVAKSEGDFNSSTSFDFATDVEAAIKFLRNRKEFNKSEIGLVGHSEGGLIAPIVASRNSDVSYIILLAGPGVIGRKVLESQAWEIAKKSGATDEVLEFNKTITGKLYDVVLQENEMDSIETKTINSLKEFRNELIETKNPFAMYVSDVMINNIASMGKDIWMTTFIKTDPQKYLKQVTCPVLALNGGKDLQILPKLNLKRIESSLKMSNNNDVTIKELDGLNHLFQTSETGLFSEYETIEETFSPIALAIIKDWILERF